MDNPSKHADRSSDWVPTDLREQAYTLERRAFVRCRLALLQAGDGCLAGEHATPTETCRREAGAAWEEWETSVTALRRLAHRQYAAGLSQAPGDRRRQAADLEEQAFRRLMEALVRLRHRPEAAELMKRAAAADAEWQAALSKLEPFARCP